MNLFVANPESTHKVIFADDVPILMDLLFRLLISIGEIFRLYPLGEFPVSLSGLY